MTSQEWHLKNTYFIDIDGTLLEHIEDYENIEKYNTLRALPKAAEKTNKWYKNGDIIILTTARPERMRNITIEQLDNAGIKYHKLLMDLGGGIRYLINDVPKKYSRDKAISFNVLRNIEGLQNVDDNDERYIDG